MEKFVPLEKQSKKAQKAYHQAKRRTWEELNPITRVVPSGKDYNRNKEKQRLRKGDDHFLKPLKFFYRFS